MASIRTNGVCKALKRFSLRLNAHISSCNKVYMLTESIHHHDTHVDMANLITHGRNIYNLYYPLKTLVSEANADSC